MTTGMARSGDCVENLVGIVAGDEWEGLSGVRGTVDTACVFE